MSEPDNINIDHLKNLFFEPLTEALGDADLMAGIELLGDHQKTRDASIKMIIRDVNSNPRAVVLYSSPVSPDMVGRGIKMAKRAKDVLGNKLGAVILDPLKHGTISKRSYGIFSYRQPISNFKPRRFLQKRKLLPSITRWLKDITAQTSHPVPDNEITQNFIRPLEHLMELKEIGTDIHTASQRAKNRLESGKWVPRYTLMHNDLWEDNILIDNASFYPTGQKNSNKFVIIDWPGSNINGYAIYDLVRLALSMGLKGNRFINEVSGHCEILYCEPEDAVGYLLVALGNIALNLEYFPFETFIKLAKLCYGHIAPDFYGK